MSHEIRTPMNAILGMLRLLQNTALLPRQLDYAVKAEGAARSLLGLLNDILDFSKVEAGKMTLDPRPFRTDRLLRDLSVILSANVGPRGVEVLFDIDPQVPQTLLGDDMRLQQVLINLGGNAIKFTERGEVVLRLRVLERGDSDVLLEFAVRDSGIGIAPENQARIFSGFTQAEASTTRRFGGTGLGLAICQRLVAMMGGELLLDSTLGQGSTFHFTVRLALTDLPVADADEPTLVLPPRQLGALRVLIADDNATARDVLATMVATLGWRADIAASGAEAVALAQRQSEAGTPYQAIFVDWQMPGLDGWETSRRIRQQAAPAASTPLLVMVTANGREALAQRSSEERALLSGFLVKPVTSSMLFDAVADAHLALAQPELLRRRAPDRGQRLAGLRLLVVEDNANNQQVAQELLTDEGALVELAANGLIGLEAVAAADPPFDAVLMDLQMPVMDGFTATSRIRSELGLAALPIIAMTANAMASDREACLAAGMNDHVGKPFDLTQLVTLLRRLTGHTGHTGNSGGPQAAGGDGAAVQPLAAGEIEAATHHGVDLSGALHRLGGNRGVYGRMLQSFLKELDTIPVQLGALLSNGTQDGADDAALQAARLMHTLKGLAGTLGAQGLAQAAAQCERQLAHGLAAGPAAALLNTMKAAMAQARVGVVEVGQLLAATPDGATGPTTDMAAQLAAVTELAGLLRSADMRAFDVFDQLRREPDAGHWQALDDAMAALDFDTALTHCAALAEELQA
jgi:CheY-like chemotaxis protein